MIRSCPTSSRPFEVVISALRQGDRELDSGCLCFNLGLRYRERYQLLTGAEGEFFGCLTPFAVTTVTMTFEPGSPR